MTKKLLSLLILLTLTLSGFGQTTRKGSFPGPVLHPAPSLNGQQKMYPVEVVREPEPLLALTPDNYRFFGGDTLDGFDFTAAFAKLTAENPSGRMAESEKKHYMMHLEASYVKTKYHLPESFAPERHSRADRLKELTERLAKERKAGGNPHPLAGCNNADFELGNYTGWTGAYGFNAGAIPNGLSMFVNSWTISSPSGANASVHSCQPHTLISGGTDPYAGIPCVDPGGGNWDARLGGDNYNLEGVCSGAGYIDPGIHYTPTPPYWIYPGYSYAQTSTTAYSGGGYYSGAELLEQSFTVDATNALFTYNYSVILQDGGHPAGDMPYFEVDVFDGSGAVIPCLQYYQECSSGTPPSGYYTSGAMAGVYCSGWQSNTLDLSGYMGQTITIYFSAAGCSWGGHFGYAYIDGSCGPKSLYVSTPAACVGQTMTVTAPPSPTGTTFLWTGPGIVGSATGSVVTVNTDGVYTVKVTPGNGCSYTVSATVTFAQPATITPSQADVNCNGNHNGTATAVASGGNPAYTYNWTGAGYAGGGQGTSTATGLSPGTYTCTINTANGCPSSQVYTITQPAALAVTPTQTNLTCNGAGTGSATASVSGGSPGYTYAWTPSGGSGTTASSLAAGTYTCTIHDANSCSTSQTFTITQPAALSVTPSQTNANCNGGTGSATVAIGGGTPGYTYTWTPSGGSATTAPGLAAGTYTCTVHDANGCPTSHTFTITQPTTLGLSTSSQTNVACNGNNSGSATVAASGGTPGYTYTWAPSGGSGATASTLTAGTYTCTIHDVNNCTTSQTVTITQPAAALSQTPTQANVACNGNTNGTASVAIAGGTAGYTYTWAPAPGGGQGTANATGLGAGNYTVTIHDANNCVLTNVFTITAPAVLSTGVSQLNESCNGGSTGSITVTPAGGTPGYTYNWTPSGGTGVTASGLGAGTYTCSIKDAHNCSLNQVVTLTQPTAVAVTPTQTTTGCGTSVGTATATASGGTPGYTYTWSPAPGGGQGTNHATGLGSGIYTVTVHDNNACATTQTYSIVSAGGPSSSVASLTNSSCSASCNGTATVSLTGGTGPFVYSWSPSGGAAATASSLCAGTYTCSVTDANNCTTSQSITITAPAVLSVTPSQTNVNCNGASTGSATAVAAGGTAGYTYSWTPSGGTASTASTLAAGTYTCTIHDAHGCSTTQAYTITQATALAVTPTQTNVSCNGGTSGTATVAVTGGTAGYTYNWTPSGGTGVTASSLAAGNYTCTIKDANNCTTTQTFAIVQPAVLSAAPSQTNASCNGSSTGSATVVAAGGTPTYTYAWTPSGGIASTASALAAGTYTCTVQDSKGCNTSQTFTITQPAVLSITPTSTQTGCGIATGTATASVSGGTSSYTYAWAPSGGTGATASNLAAGNYTVTVTDAKGCTQNSVYSITSAGAPTASLSSSTPPSCNASCNGVATVTASGGTGSLTYSWSPSGGNAATATGLCAGNYSCTITDANNCSVTQAATITQPALLAITPAQTNATCNGGSTGTATATVSGGTSAYTYAWAPSGGTAMTASGLAAGVYTCNVTDANGCTTSQSFTIGQPTPLSTTPSQTNVLCNGGSSGTATVAASGGTAAYSYAWSPSGGSAATANGLNAGTFTCTVTDANGCTTAQNFTITEPTVLGATGSTTAATCSLSNGTAEVTATGGTATYTYNWTPSGGTGVTASGLAPGVYTCVVTDANGCSANATVTIANSGSKPVASISNSGGLSFCAGTTVTLTAGGGGTYSWNNAATTPAITVGTAGTYEVYVSNACGTDSSSVTLSILPLPNPVIAGASSMCQGDSIQLNASGGTSYVWHPGGLTTPSLWVHTGGTYSVTATNGCGSTTTSTTITLNSVSANFTANDTSGSYPLPVTFTDGSASTAVSWSWNFGDGNTSNSQNPNNTFSAIGVYTVTLTVTNAAGCTSTHSEVIHVGEIPSFITVPNVFTPNGDGVNDQFFINYAGIVSFNCKIYDRWGVAMAELTGPGQPWDGHTMSGELASMGTYYYELHAQGDDGKTYNMQGYITLMRQ